MNQFTEDIHNVVGVSLDIGNYCTLRLNFNHSHFIESILAVSLF